ncbi:potassium channel family protein [Halodesulfurarchaeum sp.]|uniref:potassium channel family protein n=1 Tax=Halodesulfurarchaeum sp. TaxID=1980530 RepID=UPI001BBB3A67|nr:NAD-binding protein [Halodesulfurarchaeum sp.]
MERTRRHGIYYLGAMVILLLLYTILYQFGMTTFEGVERGFFESLQIVIESVTTTGYGEDAQRWSTIPLVLLMITMQLTGVFFLFLTLPLFLVPWIENRLEETLPRSYSGSEHVIICGQNGIGPELIEELESRGVDYVVLHTDPDVVGSLLDSGYSAVHGDPETTAALEQVSLEDARAVILDSEDERNANIALSIRQRSDSVPIVAFVEDSSVRPYLELAGVDTPLNPRELLGEGLAKEVSRVITTQLGSTIDISVDFEVIELPVHSESDIEGHRLETAQLRERAGVTVLGAWTDGEFLPNPNPSMILDRQTVLLVAGSRSQLRSAMELTIPGGRPAHQQTVMAGYGDTGKAVCDALESSFISCQVIDCKDLDRADVVGDAKNAGILREAGIESAGALIITVGDDTEAIFITLVARKLNPDIEIVVRANDSENRSKFFAAGADYVLPLAEVSARMIAATILGEDVITYETQIDIVKLQAPRFEGQTIVEAAIREQTGCTVIAVERDDQTITDLGPDFKLIPEDTLVVAGTDEDLLTLQEVAGTLGE